MRSDCEYIGQGLLHFSLSCLGEQSQSLHGVILEATIKQGCLHRLELNNLDFTEPCWGIGKDLRQYHWVVLINFPMQADEHRHKQLVNALQLGWLHIILGLLCMQKYDVCEVHRPVNQCSCIWPLL